jgi:hypothetical protein
MPVSLLAMFMPTMPILGTLIWVGGGSVGLIVLIVILVLILR